MALVVKSSFFGGSGAGKSGAGSGASRVVAFETRQQQQRERLQVDTVANTNANSACEHPGATAGPDTAEIAPISTNETIPKPWKRVSSTETARATIEAHRADSRWQRKRVTMWKALLFIVDCAATGLTLMTVLRENMLIVGFTGRYDSIRSRLLHGSINYSAIHNELVDPRLLPDLEEVSKTWRFYMLPPRNPTTVNEDRSMCLRVNSISGNFMGINYDDHWGKGVRRDQLYLFSISAFNCQVINFMPTWMKTNCTQLPSSSNSDSSDPQSWEEPDILNSVNVPQSSAIPSAAANASRCNRYILKHFDTLKLDRTVQTGVVKDPGIVGMPFLKCLGRADEKFQYLTDLIVHQSYWRGGPFHGEFQTSECTALPVAKTKDQTYTLFQAVPVDKGVKVIAAFDQDNWLRYLVSLVHSIVSIVMIFRGLMRAILRSDIIQYVPQRARFRGFRSYVLATLQLTSVFPENQRNVITFQGAVSLAPAEWMNHWVYSTVSIADAIANLRPTAVIFQLSVYMINFKMTFSNFLFMFSAVTKMTWMICLFTSLLRITVKLLLRLLRVIGLQRNSRMVRIEWYVDAANIFVSYKMYSVMLCVLLGILVESRKSTTFMVRQPNPKRALYGSVSDIAGFWESEIVNDFQVLFGIILLCGMVLSLFLVSCTKYRCVAHNRVIRALQARYLFVGWDVFSTMENLGMDPFNDDLVDPIEHCAMTNCSYGALIQQFSVSGPSGFLDFAGDDIFLAGDYSGCHNVSTQQNKPSPPPALYYTPYKAMCMGLLDEKLQKTTKRSAAVANNCSEDSPRETEEHDGETLFPFAKREMDTTDVKVVPVDKRGAVQSFDWTGHVFHLHVESRWGKVLLVDDLHCGHFMKNPQSHQFEYVVRDALTYIPEEERHTLLVKDRRFRIR